MNETMLISGTLTRGGVVFLNLDDAVLETSLSKGLASNLGLVPDDASRFVRFSLLPLFFGGFCTHLIVPTCFRPM